VLPNPCAEFLDLLSDGHAHRGVGELLPFAF
jgi:hypothetical protein